MYSYIYYTYMYTCYVLQLANDTLYNYVEVWLENSSHNQLQNVRFRLEPHLLPSLA